MSQLRRPSRTVSKIEKDLRTLRTHLVQRERNLRYHVSSERTGGCGSETYQKQRVEASSADYGTLRREI